MGIPLHQENEVCKRTQTDCTTVQIPHLLVVSSLPVIKLGFVTAKEYNFHHIQGVKWLSDIRGKWLSGTRGKMVIKYKGQLGYQNFFYQVQGITWLSDIRGKWLSNTRDSLVIRYKGKMVIKYKG